MINNLYAIFFSIILTNSLFAQADYLWADAIEGSISVSEAERQIVPDKYRVMELDFAKMKKLLAKAPKWSLAEGMNNAKVIAFPMPDGTTQHFEYVNASVFSEGLAQKYPEIQSFKGRGIEDPTASIVFDISPQGFHAMVLSTAGTWFIDPYAKGNTKNYNVYYKKYLKNKEPFTCLVDEQITKSGSNDEPEDGDCQYRTYRLALACTGEYAQFHGGTVNGVLAAMNTTINRINGVYEREFAIRLILIDNNDQIIFFDANTDGYTNNDGLTMLDENQTKIDNIIGTANYDIGHVFSTGGGGIAQLHSPCGGGKARGVTGRGQPVGDAFDIDYVAHEMGHQFGGHHTQNNDCNRTNATSMEPGSASSIMGYAGICFPNVQNFSDDFFHAINIQEVHSFITGFGGTCANVSPSNNTPPTVNGGADYAIPISTPFVLEALGNDDDGDPITYTWDQMDPEVAPMPPQASSLVGPTFKGFSPTISPKRYFPNLTAIVQNTTPTWEVLPAVSRELNFRVIARDNHPGKGCNASDNVVINTIATAGPFVVTQPNTNLDWPALSSQTVTWNVANTDVAPIDATHVNLLLSLDGGLTYPHTLASNVLNDGSQQVTMPNETSTTARVMVKAKENVFFDISNTNFTISEAQQGFTVAVSSSSLDLCSTTPSNLVFTVNSIQGFSGAVDLSAENIPTGLTVSFNPSTVIAPGNATVTFSGSNSLTDGYHSIGLKGTSITNTLSEDIHVFYANNAPNQSVLIEPLNMATGAAVAPILKWNVTPDVQNYKVELYSDAALTSLVESANTAQFGEHQIVTTLNPSSTYYWRVLADNPCQQGVVSTAFSFTTEAIFCNDVAAMDVPITIPQNLVSIKTSTINIEESGDITAIRINNLDITHSYINDLIIKLIAPDGTEVILLDQICGNENNLLLSFDDEAQTDYLSIPCPPTGGNTYQPKEALASLVGKDINGDWILSVTDVFDGDGGQINGWSIDFCYYVESLTLSVNVSNVACKGEHSGSAQPVVAGGAEPYTYNWSTGNGQNLAKGNYSVTVTDANGNSTVKSFEITEPDELTATGTLTDATFGVADGTIDLTVNGGTMAYSYLWSNDKTTKDIDGLAAGNYTVIITDAHNCTLEKSFAVQESCPIPAQLSVEIVSSTSVKLAWGNLISANSYQIKYRVVGSSSWETVSATDNFITLTSLDEGANYEFKVQAHCPGGWSPYSELSNFATPEPCDAPLNIETVTVNSNTATISWEAFANATSYVVRYKVLGNTLWQVQSTGTNSISLTGLMPATSYEVIVQSICGSFDSGYTDTFVFTTMMGCTPPVVTITNLTYQGVVFSWPPITGVSQYAIRYRKESTLNWSSLVVSSVNLTLESLEPGATYEFQFQSKCGVAWSDFSILETVTLHEGCAVLSLAVETVSSNSIDLVWNETVGATKYNIGYKKAGTTDAWVTQIVNSPAGSIIGLEPNTAYDFRVQAFCEFGWGLYAAVLTEQTNLVGNLEPTVQLSFLYFPNPVSSRLTITFSATPVEIMVLNVLGQVVLAEKASSNMEILVQDLKPGLYFMQVEFLDGHFELAKFFKE